MEHFKSLLFLSFIITIFAQPPNTVFYQDPSYSVFKEICYNTDKSYALNYEPIYTKTVNDFLKFIQYDFSQEKSHSTSYLYKIFARNDLTLETNPSEKYIFTISRKYIFNKGVLVICFLWVAIGICYISGVFLNKEYLPKSPQKNFWPKVRNITFVFIVLLSLICLYKKNKIFLSFNGTTCYLARFLQEVKLGMGNYNEGRIFTEKYRWPGILTLGDILIGVDTFLGLLHDKNKINFGGLDKLNKNISIYKEKILNMTDKIEDYSIEINGTKIIPSYIDCIINMNNSDSLVYNLLSEYKSDLNYSLEYIYQIYKVAENMERNRVDYMNNIKNMHNKTNEFAKLINLKASNITHNLRFLHENIISDIYDATRDAILFNVFVSTSVLFLSLLVNYFWGNILKYSLHLGWNLLMITILISIILSYFLFSVGNNILDLIYILHKNVLKVDQNNFFDTCLNRDGNLLKLFNNNSQNNILEFNNYFEILQSNTKTLTALISSPTLKESKEKLNNYFTNEFLLSSNNNPKDEVVNKIISHLEKITNDRWVGNKNQCNDYRYFSKNEIEKKLLIGHNKTCLTFKDQLSEDNLLILYREKTPEILEEINNIVSNLNLFYIKNEQIISIIEFDIDSLEKKNINITQDINKMIENIEDFIKTFIDLFPTLDKNDKVSDMFNCSVLKNELIIYYDLNAKYVYKELISTAILNIIIGILSFIGVFCIIFYIIWKEPKFRKFSLFSEDEEELKDENNDDNERELEIIQESEKEQDENDEEEQKQEKENQENE